jgi:hypothetical protein
MRHRLAFALALVLGLSAAVWADPPARVARLNFVSGSVSFRPASLDDWTDATVNYPLSTGDHLWADQDAQAELHVGSTVFRLGAQTAIEFLNLDDRTIQIRLSQGSLSVRARRLPEDEVLEVDTPNSAVSIDRPGLYRIDVTEEGRSTVTVREGDLELTAAGEAVPLRSSEQAVVDGTDSPTYDVGSAGPPDSFDDWGLDRDRHEDNIASTQYVSSEVVGYEDLDTYGHWRDVPNYGPVWAPATVEVGWAPYRAGHWGWVAPWGWTWIDDAPWGFAPFHYGRWAYIEGSWGWCPGTIVARPVYAPALVAFVGGGGWSASLSFGGGFGVGAAAVAWFPLGPHEVYVPPYPVSAVYVQQVNITHVTNINVNNFTVNNGIVTNVNIQKATYVNQVAPGAVTAVPQAAFVGARSVRAVAVVVPPRAITTAGINAGPPSSMHAEPASVLGHPQGSGNARRPSAAVLNRSFVAKVAPPPPAPAFSPILKPVTTNLPPKPASQATNYTRLKPAVPAGGGPGLKPARPNLVKARSVHPSETHARPVGPNNSAGQRNDRPGAPMPKSDSRPANERPSSGGDLKPTPRPEPGANDRPRPDGLSRPTPRPEPGVNDRARPEETPRPTPRPEPGVNDRPRPEGTPRPTPRPEPGVNDRPRPEGTPRPTPRPEPGVNERPRPEGTPRPTPRPEPGTNDRPRPEGTPRPTPRPEPGVNDRPRSEPTSQPTQVPHHDEPKPTPKPNSKPTPKPSPQDR